MVLREDFSFRGKNQELEIDFVLQISPDI